MTATVCSFDVVVSPLPARREVVQRGQQFVYIGCRPQVRARRLQRIWYFFSLEAISRCSISFSSRSSRVWALSLSSNSSLISRRPSCVSCFSLITSSSILTRVWPSLWKLSSICQLSVALCWCGQWRICEKRVSVFCCAACMKVLQFPSQGPGKKASRSKHPMG